MVKAEAEMMFFMITVTHCYSFYLCVEFILFLFCIIKNDKFAGVILCLLVLSYYF